jgi:hypothetical protein
MVVSAWTIDITAMMAMAIDWMNCIFSLFRGFVFDDEKISNKMSILYAPKLPYVLHFYVTLPITEMEAILDGIPDQKLFAKMRANNAQSKANRL